MKRDLRHVTEPLRAALVSYADELTRDVSPDKVAEIRGAVESAFAQLREAARIAGVRP